MKQQGSGVIINTASELAIVAQPLYSAYCASQGAVLSFTRALALEYAQDNIRINAVCPSPVNTKMLQQEFDVEPNPAKAREANIATIPIGRLGKPEEIAAVALFLASDALLTFTWGIFSYRWRQDNYLTRLTSLSVISYQ